METRSLAKVSVPRKTENGSQKIHYSKETTTLNGSNSLKRPRNPQDDLINTRLRSPKLPLLEIQGKKHKL